MVRPEPDDDATPLRGRCPDRSYGLRDDLRRGTPVLNRGSVTRAFATPETGIGSDGSWYGCGWQVRNVTGGRNTWHTGSLPGTSTLLVRRFDGLTWSVLFDQRDDAANPNGTHYGDIDQLLHKAANSVRTWPGGDLSAKYYR
ncbi:MAG: hypothetical protein JWN00_3122 [Actinomycetia bacterium]|nr:hypothetical protein [Actinomycetes bacterium]